MSNKKSTGNIIIVILILNILFIGLAIFFANFIFTEWQKIPSEHLSYNTIYLYHQQYGHLPKVATAIKGSIGAGLFAWFILNVGVLIALFVKPKRELHGSARFANDMEIRQYGFLPTPKDEEKAKKKFPSRPPVIIGKHKDKFLQFYGNEFISIGAPTRSGKGVGIVIPNLLTYPDSVVVLDIKMENWLLTAGFRAKYQDVYLFAPEYQIKNEETGELENFSHCYNPLDYIDRHETKRIGDIQKIAQMFFPADGKDPFWDRQAQRIFTGLVLYMLETPSRPCTMAELIRLTTPVEKALHEWIPDTINQRKDTPIVINNETGETAIRPLSAECVQALMAFVNVDADSTRSSILASLMSPLNVFTDPAVASATSKSDFNFRDVRRKKMSIYIGVQPESLAKFSVLLNLFFSQMITENATLPEHDKSLKYQCLLLMDEFTSLGRVGAIQTAIAWIAGYNMRLMPIFQNRSQVVDAYGKDGANAIFSNIACQIEYPPTKQEEAEELSRALGTQTVKSKSISRNRGKGGGGSVSVSDQSRALMLAQELKEMPYDEQIILFRNAKPIRCKKAFYYQNPQVFASRMTDMNEPPQGLPIPKRKQPPKLDVLGTLKVMRGYVDEVVDSHTKLPPTEKLNADNPEYLKQVGAEFGFNEEFFAYIDSLDKNSVEELLKKERTVGDSVEPSDNPNEVDFDLDDPSEFDPDFIQEVYDEFAGLF